MEKLPDELVLQVLAYLDVSNLVRCRKISRRFRELGSDQNLWKLECFAHSRAESKRRRQLLLAGQDSSLAALRNAVNDLSPRDIIATSAVPQLPAPGTGQRARALANWEPSYPGEAIDYYQDYVRRHAKIAPIGWLNVHSQERSDSQVAPEATGIGVLRRASSGGVDHVVAPLDNGSIAIWNLGQQGVGDRSGRGRLLGRSAVGRLSGQESQPNNNQALAASKSLMTEVGAVECVSIDSDLKRGYFAVQNALHEIDLGTLQAVSRVVYPFVITALSDADLSTPITVGTASTMHIYDPRNMSSNPPHDPSFRCELIGGPIASHVSLSQPGPLSILHHACGPADDHSIWVAGRFTHLLNYDRRSFPRLRGTVHSGARISCLTSLPYPHVPRSIDLFQDPTLSIHDRLDAKSAAATTLIAAGVYKGKGSLELYGIPAQASTSGLVSSKYQNRQTASSSKLLSVTSHGASFVFSDGDGNIKWIERDGFTPIRSHNINEPLEHSFNQAQSLAQDSIFEEMAGQGDIVQKIVSTQSCRSRVSSLDGRCGTGSDDLLLWTGDGRLGVLGFGYECPIAAEEFQAEAKNAEQRALEDAERQYSGTLRRALQSSADEARFMRGLGLGYR